MIQANELRIGNNVVWDNPILNIKEQIQINCEDFELITNKNLGNKYHPIPLTPEILEKCGFDSDWSYDIPKYQKNNFIMFWDGETLSASFGHMVDLSVYLKHLHQLQNLYYALTGEELTINL